MPYYHSASFGAVICGVDPIPNSYPMRLILTHAPFFSPIPQSAADLQVTLLDASTTPGGLSSAFTSDSGEVVEPGIKGFWWGYSNIVSLVEEELNLTGSSSPFTPFTRSSFWSPEGLQVGDRVCGVPR
jgi:hypothetical protein